MTVADIKLLAPKLQIMRGPIEAPEIIEIQTINPDLVRWDMTRAKHNWPKTEDAPQLWLTFLGWAACRREGRIGPDDTYEKWSETVLDLQPLDDGESEAGTPILPGLDPG